MVEIVVQHGDEWSVERKVLFEKARLGAVRIRYFRGRARARALHLESDARDAVGEEDVSAVGFVGLRRPIVADGRAVGLERERAGNFTGGAFRGLDVRGPFGEPAAARRRNLKFLVAHSLAGQFDGEFSFILCEDAGAGRAFLLSGKRQSCAGCESQDQSNAGCS